MEEFKPRKKYKIITREFLAKNIYVLVLAVLLLGGITYGYTFFIQNKKIESGSITTSALTINFTDRGINASNLSIPNTDQEGLIEFSKTVTITNVTTIDGIVKLTLTRTSGLNLTDLRYALVVNGAIQEIKDVPANGEIIETAIMGSETINVEIRLWPKTTYQGSETTFVGELTPEIKYLGKKASDYDNLSGKYVNFNCNNGTCEVWRIVKVEDDRLVITRTSDYEGAGERVWTGKYYSGISFNDNSLISSVSDDNDHKNVYLLRTVKINDGSGTLDDPYTLTNSIFSEPDKKKIATITYKNGDTTIGTQNIYYGETNYISKYQTTYGFTFWNNNGNEYYLGDTVNFTQDITLIGRNVLAEDLDFNNEVTNFNCTDAQCTIEKLNDLFELEEYEKVFN